ncbi:MAG: (Fe-S)-binding protein, partial [Solirubrobacteraceae bacterium]
MRGEELEAGWRSEEVKDALDLCLACKGCKHECPVRVDMATYKAEFRFHHYKHRLRPLSHYALGLIYWEAQLASRMPALANLLTQQEPIATLAKRAVGVSPKRRAPRFASQTFRDWFAAQPPHSGHRGRVLLWPDTFTNHFEPEIAIAATEVLQDAGFEVSLPRRPLCCGRPLYDYGFLDAAERYLRRLVGRLAPYARAGVPVVGMEPSCLAVLRDELAKMLPHDDDAARVADHALHFAELFDRHDADVPRLEGQALLWGHCHQRATGGTDADRRVLERMGLEVEPLVGGCCGLAGSWGFEKGKYEISMECGEQALLPAVRRAGPETVVVANGFSCKTQIVQAGTGRRALHLGEVLQLAQRREAGIAGGGRPEE